MTKRTDDRVSLLGAVSIGVGGMVGGGIFAVLGLAAVLAGGATPLAFLVAGIISLLTAYSYAKMSVCYPSRGGTVTILDKAFGVSLLTGSANSLLWLAYVVTLALYAVAFGNYAVTFLDPASQTKVASHILISVGIIAPTILNLASASLISKAETYIVVIKLVLLLVVIIFGIGSVDSVRLQPATWEDPLQIVSAGMIIFVAYEGFELIANTAEDIQDYKVNLPRAYFITVAFVIVIYVLIAAVVVGSLEPSVIKEAEDFALAEAAKPSLGEKGFTLVGVAAILATLSAINSTLYGSARLTYTIAAEGELPKKLEEKIWGQPVGLLITSGAALLLANTIELSSISTMASAAFLIIFGIVNLAGFVKHKESGSSPLLCLAGVVGCFSALATLVYHTYTTAPIRVLFLLAMVVIAVVIEGLYRATNKGSGPRIASSAPSDVRRATDAPV